jgi:hypothetical protein
VRIAGALIAIVATVATAVVVMSFFGPSPAGTQPWSSELADNLWLARAIPFVVGLGVLLGLIGGSLFSRGRDARSRFSPAVIVGHWIATIGFLIAVPTGLWQYMGGIVDSPGPFPVYLYYRFHYIGAAIILVSLAGFLTYWWITGDRSLTFPRREWRRYVRGALQEIPRRIAQPVARFLKVDLAEPAGTPGTFTFYEKFVSFPSWTAVIALVVITGLVKALRYVIPIPGTIIFIDSTLHVAGAVLVTIKVLDHLRYTFERWPLVVAMMTSGRVPRDAERSARAPETAAAARGEV